MRINNEIIKYAYQKVPFYNNLYKNCYSIWEDNNYDINVLPYVSKEMVLKEKERMISAEYVMNEEKLVKCKTSGSTGICLNVFWDSSEYKKDLFQLWLERRNAANINPWDRYCYFFTTSNYKDKANVFVEHNRFGIGFSKSELTEETIKDIYYIMVDYEPIWLMLQPSIAFMLCQVIKKNKLPPLKKLRYIELTGEMLFENTKRFIEDTFSCEIRNQYGCNEVNSIAYECRCGNLHINNNVFVEILNNGLESSEEGEICVTSFNNHAMPFIRYRTGDIGILKNDVLCECGSKAPILKLTKGRMNDVVYGKNGEQLNSYIFVHAIEMTNLIYKDCIQQFQFIQKAINQFLVKLVLDFKEVENLEELAMEIIRNVTNPELNNAEYKFEFYECLGIQENGKLRYFKNEITYQI